MLSCAHSIGVRMSNFRSETDKQKKLTVVRSKPADSANHNLLSFFETVSREKREPPEKEPATLGLLAYMSEEDRQTYKTNWNSSTNSSANHQGIEKYTTTSRSKSVWDDLDSLPPEKVAKTGTKGAVTLCSLLDSDSSNATDPWKEYESRSSDIPFSSTPHHKGVTSCRGPLDAFSKSGNVDQWSHVTDRTATKPNKLKSRRKQLVTESANSRPVNSYFGKTKSVWQDVHPSSDEDIICLSDKADSVTSQSHSKMGKKPQKKRGRPRKSPAKTISNITAFSRARTLHNDAKSNGPTTPTRQREPCPDVITLSD